MKTDDWFSMLEAMRTTLIATKRASNSFDAADAYETVLSFLDQAYEQGKLCGYREGYERCRTVFLRAIHEDPYKDFPNKCRY